MLAGLSLLPATAMGWAADGTTLAPIVVTATRTERTADDAPVRTEVVTQEELRRTRARTLKEALENVPGLQLREVHGKSGYELSLQGLSGDQVLVLVDGLPITASTGSTVDLSQYLLAGVERVEVVKGASSAQYGSAAMGGVVNVITRPISAMLNGEVAAEGGSRGSQNVDGSPSTGHARARVEGGVGELRWRVTGDVFDDDGFAVVPDGWAQQGDVIRREQAAVRLAWVPSTTAGAWVDGSTYRESDEQRYLYYVPPQQVPQSRTEEITRNRLSAGGHWTRGDGLRAEVKGVSERYDTESIESSAGTAVSRRTAAMSLDHVSAQVDLPAWHRQLWQFGGDVRRERLDQQVNDISELGNGRASRSSHELFAQNDVVIDDTWELVLGARWQDDSDFGRHVVPKVAVKIQLPDAGDWRTTLRASAGQGYRVPNLKERHYLFDHSALGYIVIGNPDLKPEASNSFQLGGTVARGDGLSVDLNLFYNRVKDLIQVDGGQVNTGTGITAYTYGNVGRARTQGVEAGVRWQVAPSLGVSASYTLTETRNLDTGGELTRRPRDMARIGADWSPHTGTTLTLRGRWQSDELVDSTTAARSPAWATADMVVNQSLGAGVTVFGGVTNLFDRQRDFADANDYGPISGRYVHIGLTYAFGNTTP